MSSEASFFPPSSPKTLGDGNWVDAGPILEALRALRRGTFFTRMPMNQTGVAGEIAEAFNDVADLLEESAHAIEKVSHEAGREGRFTARASLPGASGGWSVFIEGINQLIGDLVGPLSEIAQVIRAVERGEMSRRIPLDWEGRPLKGEYGKFVQTVNTMVEQVGSFASKVTQVAREVGTEGKLGGQVEVQGSYGVWKELAESINKMASSLTYQVRNIDTISKAFVLGDFTTKTSAEVQGEALELQGLVTSNLNQFSFFTSELSRLAREVGTEGKLGTQARDSGLGGIWKELTDNVNSMAANLTNQMRNMAEVAMAIAQGDLSKKITVEVQGEMAVMKTTINSMVDQLGSFASEVTRVAREVGTEGKLGGQAEVRGVAGTWKELTDNVNGMASNLTTQMRNISGVATAVAVGDLSKKITVEVKGEILQLKNTINTMVDQLNSFSSEVTRVAREVGTEGKLGGQAKVQGVAGTWKELTDNVNGMALNLTNQVRAIGEVATAVSKGDLTRAIKVEARGEVNELKVNINQMIDALRDTTKRNTEQAWLKSNLAEFTGKLQGQRDLLAVARLILSKLCPLVQAQHGVYYNAEFEDKSPVLKLVASYAYKERKGLANCFHLGEGLVGQCGLEKERILMTNVPADYVHISSGLGDSQPLNIVVLPVLFEGEIKGVIELASFTPFTDIHLNFLDQLTEGIGIVQNTIQAGMRTEHLLLQSQSQSEELQSQQEELKESNIRLEEQARNLKKSEEILQQQQGQLRESNENLGRKADELSREKAQVEAKNREIELGRAALAERAEQLTVSSKYKSEFLANMSHELRTPLNSLLILARLLGDNPEKNLSEKQVSYANTIQQSGLDLLNLINEILDMAKIEAGKMAVDISEVSLEELQGFVEGTFQPMAKDKGLEFLIKPGAGLPKAITTDMKRLQQVLRNLLSNAFKFTEKGRVELQIELADSGWSYDQVKLNGAQQVISFAVVDTGIGIAADKLNIIFEPFMQADGSTSRKHGGTGLGLSISREVARVLGGEIKVRSALGKGSVFTLYLPTRFPGEDNTPNGSPPQGMVLDQPRQAPPGPEPTFHSRVTPIPISRENPLALADPGPEDNPQGSKGPAQVAFESKIPAAHSNGQSAPLTYQAPASPAPLSQATLIPPAPSPAPPSQAPLARAIIVPSLPGRLEVPEVPSQPGRLEVPESAPQRPGERVLLIIEDDPKFAAILAEMAMNQGFRPHIAATGADALEMIKRLKPDAITLDIQLPDMLGWTLLDQIKHTPASRHIPVHIISVEDQQQLGLRLGAQSYLVKPVTRNALETELNTIRALLDRPTRELLVVEDDEVERLALCDLIGSQDVHITAVGTGKEAVALLKKKNFDCLLLDLGLGDMSGFDLIKLIKSNSALCELPIIVFTGKDLSQDEKDFLSQAAKSVVIKGVDTIDRLLNETALFLHRVERDLPPEKQARIRQVYESNPEFKDRQILIVDDDKRNLFALNAILEPQHLKVHKAESGRAALKMLEKEPNIDAVIMDIMMPDMDGYETTRAIRGMNQYKSLPIIALTAKAMKTDRDKCIEAGCSDYIAKPALPEQLLSLLRVWLHR